MSISAVPVIAKILIDLGLMRRELGMLILAAGIVDDTTGWLLLSLVAGLAAAGAIDLQSVGVLVIEVAAVRRLLLLHRLRLVVRLMRWVDDRALASSTASSARWCGIAMVCAIVTQAIGLARGVRRICRGPDDWAARRASARRIATSCRH